MRKQLRITVEGRAYDVTFEVIGEEANIVSGPAPAAAAPAPAPAAPAPAPTPAPAPAAPAAPSAPAPAGSVPSPLAGKVVAIDAPVGTAVKEGDNLITLEAMKMNTFVQATSDGTVKEVLVNPGDAVEEGQALLTLG